jgi:hypothetical protein
MEEYRQYIEERFWPKVRIKGEDDCWLWMNHAFGGYGKLTINPMKRTFYTHRLSYLLKHGLDNPVEVVRHTCGNRLCVNPKHLIGGTHIDNMEDRRKPFQLEFDW